TDLAPQMFRVRAGFDHAKKINRLEFVRAHLCADAQAGPVAHKHGRSGAGVLSSLVGADGLVVLPETMTELKAGALVDFLPFSEVMP
ncbi:MAG: hypothetical protein CFH40_02298, partial [Alphaproteobacteria bacterium MarineAlpha10_Bin3]